MQKQQALHYNAEAAGANMKFRNSRRYIVMQKQQALHGNEEVVSATL
jgi:hypothetical protein